MPWYTQTIDGLNITFTLHNPTGNAVYFDYAIDGDTGTSWPGSTATATQGPLSGLQFGNSHTGQSVLSAHQTTTVTKTGNSEIKIGVHFGPEQMNYLDWATFTAQ